MMKKRETLLLLAWAITAFVNGLVSEYFEQGSVFARTDFVFMLAGGLIIFTWYYYDSEQIKFKRGILLNTGIIAIAIIALPYYFYRSRGFKTGLMFTAIFLLVALTWSMFQLAGGYAIQFLAPS
jgi:hypothetical protein